MARRMQRRIEFKQSALSIEIQWADAIGRWSEQSQTEFHRIPAFYIDPDEKTMNTAAANTKQNIFIFVVVLFDTWE